MNKKTVFFSIIIILSACSKSPNTSAPPITPALQPFSLVSSQVNNYAGNKIVFNVDTLPLIKLNFSAPVNHSSSNNILLNGKNGSSITLKISYSNSDSTLIIQPVLALQFISKYVLTIPSGLKSSSNRSLQNPATLTLITAIDSSDKFQRISDDALLDLVQKQTLKYFTDFAHPVSGMARERNSSDEVVTIGGTGFGVMSLVAGINRNYITRAEGLTQITKIVNFLINNCTRYHGAFSHWINGATGATVPFSQKDDGADLVETSYMMQGLLCARQYFNTANVEETDLRNKINILWNGVEWNWFRQNNQNVLYWHWSPNYNWDMNFQIKGWNEALIVYALAASSNIDSIPAIVYHNGWALNGAIKNGNNYYGTQLPLGPPLGGPLFFTHYSFLGINPNGLTDNYADYFVQNVNHSKINYAYCVANPKGFYGYSNQCWGLTASDEENGYSAHAPDNDNGTITPTAAISSLPYTPVESMNALRFFYYKLGDKVWKEYGFVDAFNLTDIWFADSFLAIDQGPEIVMIENYRSGLLWNLFMSCPEIKRGMKQLGFKSPFL